MDSTQTPLKTARLERGLSVDQLAKKSDLVWKTVRNAEEARSRTSRRTRRLLSLALDTPQDILWPPGQTGGKN